MANQQHLFPSVLSRSVERVVLWMIIFLLVLSNLLTVINSSFQQSMYGLLSHIPIEGLLTNSLISNKNLLTLEKQNLEKQIHHMNAKWESRRAKTSVVSKRIAKRLAANAARNFSSVLGEAIPYLGTALIVTVTAADIKDACDTMVDINELAGSMGAETNSSDENEVCGIKIPNVDDYILR